MVLKTANEFTGVLDPEVFAALSAGACLITANNRLARHIRLAYAQRQSAAGHRAWEAPDVLPWQAFIARASEAARAQGGLRPVLNPAQERWLWSTAVAEQAPNLLCQDRLLALRAAEAWQLLADYDLPLPEASGDRESEMFVAVAGAFRRRLAALGRDDAAHEGARAATAIASGRVKVAPEVLWAGFDHITPVQEAVQAACRALGARSVTVPLPHRARQSDARVFATSAEEVTAALLWARERMNANPRGRYALVVADLPSWRRPILRRAREILAPREAPGVVPCYEISLGEALTQAPVVASALRIWHLAQGDVTAADAASLIQSPFIAGAETERASRASRAYDVLEGAARVGLAGIVRGLRGGGTPIAQAAFARLAGITRRWPKRNPASAWMGLFMNALEALGWPGAAEPEDYQAISAVHEVLESCATLDAVADGLSYAQVLAFVAGSLADRVFQARGGDAPLKILGPLEAVGLEFDGLWMMNLHDRVWPAVRPPHPFLPLAFQRAHRLPHALIEDEIAYARSLAAHLRDAAPETILSCAAHDASGPLRPSRIITEHGAQETARPVFMDRAGRAFAARLPLEPYPAIAAPLGAAAGAGPFGAGMLAAQAACPFRAWAQYRLRANPLDRPISGLSPAVRGLIVHKMLETWFAEFPRPGAWMALADDARARRISDVVGAAQAAAADDYANFPKAFMALEARRMERLLAEFLAREETRPDFVVVDREKEVSLRCGPLMVRGRIDRIDAVGGRLVLIDYKTGKMPNVDWTVDRPEYPQLLFYAAAEGAGVAGISYAGLSARGGYKGWVRDADLVPGATVVGEWETVTGAWPPLLARLASDFASGSAAVDPLEHACDYCGREAFCRIDEGGHDE
ncbi:PD-(D/E)XK nuclease family protein [Acidiferrobacter sp.]|uniref:PD-(D/E)XK nuclease family protein n=1 Tax=Acidiferrobacter sp. TaxID=1872107 RepID=UPI00261014F2|nr:PD-(D/E)XK nuclease family protein [Acidiferrobacter sp.]